MSAKTIAVRLHVAWWLRLYLYGLVICCTLTGMTPHQDRLLYWITKGLSVRIPGARRRRMVRWISRVLGV